MAANLSYDPVTKHVSALDTSEGYIEEVDALNRLTKDLVSSGLEVPENGEPSKQQTAMIQKLVNSAMDAMKRRAYAEAIKNITVAIDAASRRKRWEAFQVQLQELIGFLQLRTDAYMLSAKYADALVDADLLLLMTALTAENFLRKGIALLNLGRYDEARVVFERGLCFHEGNDKLVQHLAVSKKLIAEENGDAV
ncbi:unnamed protein product [Cyberlindnera jadinii]|uniref:Uncharacterized protein n=1 Tax=Cyberlindnera jadinii (strain ATCC 18201 / CBS 1600 / BCRC 20928 / JCM 3617 / NBRC 0987 / NRRL Y-1542) TaxID=983966 RepID=A0A0H5C2W6_CYBJN|nr:hypothetical protein CYBJADRAFT_165890 [Cyberlindnera jadinii NRRL Y-1542]ODV75134.1 hypothetical protein CYBJADRAFT_165890 [Cyberlindnera jadinii NRRL Y-1542]CEP22315.1 unnamed protein product [Cyberlindnera jadinii]